MSEFVDELWEALEEINDILPPPGETPTEVRLKQRRWDLLRAYFGEGVASNRVGLAGVPVVVDESMETDEIRIRFADGTERRVWPL